MAIDKIITTSVTDANITTAKVTDNAITLAKMASGTDGNIISYDASGNPVAVATGSDGQVLTSTGAGSPPAFEAISGGGKLLQVVNTQDTSVRSTTSQSYTKASNNFDLNITPTASNSKILLEASFGGGTNTNNERAFFTIFRGSTDLGTGDGVTTHEVTGANSSELRQHLLFMDSPSTTNQITYSIQMKGQGGTVVMNQKGVGSFVAYEIGA